MDLTPPLAGLIFDKDGTLFDFLASWGTWTQRLLLEVADGDPALAAELGRRIGYEPVHGFAPDSPVIAGTAADIAALLAPALPGLGVTELVQRMNRLAAQVPVVPVVPLAPLMMRLRARGLRLAVMTNDSETPARAHLVAAGVGEAFDLVLGADSGFGAKPDPGPLQACAQAWGLAPAQVAMIGDSRHDLAAGAAAGMRRIAVLSGLARAEELAPWADVVLPDIGALEAWLDAGGPVLAKS